MFIGEMKQHKNAMIEQAVLPSLKNAPEDHLGFCGVHQVNRCQVMMRPACGDFVTLLLNPPSDVSMHSAACAKYTNCSASMALYQARLLHQQYVV